MTAFYPPVPLSLSARRAWIEIKAHGRTSAEYRVALRKESVDRNIVALHDLIKCTGSLSARRAWIEMVMGMPIPALPHGRSPQGERG